MDFIPELSESTKGFQTTDQAWLDSLLDMGRFLSAVCLIQRQVVYEKHFELSVLLPDPISQLTSITQRNENKEQRLDLSKVRNRIEIPGSLNNPNLTNEGKTDGGL